MEACAGVSLGGEAMPFASAAASRPSERAILLVSTPTPLSSIARSSAANPTGTNPRCQAKSSATLHEAAFKLPGVTHVRSSVVPKEVEAETRLPLELLQPGPQKRPTGVIV